MSDIKNFLQANILIVDDEPLNLEVLEELLESEGYSNIICEQSPLAAIELYQQDTFDLVLLDISMPLKSGFEVMEDFRNINLESAPPILVLTASGNKTIKIKALREGASDFLTKPFDFEEVISRVNNLVKLHIAQKQLQLQRDVLELKVQQRTQQLRDSNIDVIYRLGLLADYRDTETSAHTKRVGLTSQRLAIALGLEPTYCDAILHAAPLHDIGKVGIPDSILLKPGKLDGEEWETMKEHAAIGGKILKNSPSVILQMAQEIALTHHEKWDGTGYPAGLQAQDIPISGRIVIIADVFDALSSNRPYKEAWSQDKIRTFMLKQRGLMFDPLLLDLFFEHINEQGEWLE